MSHTPPPKRTEERYSWLEKRISIWCILTYIALMATIGFIGKSVLERLDKIEVDLRKIEMKLEEKR